MGRRWSRRIDRWAATHSRGLGLSFLPWRSAGPRRPRRRPRDGAARGWQRCWRCSPARSAVVGQARRRRRRGAPSLAGLDPDMRPRATCGCTGRAASTCAGSCSSATRAAQVVLLTVYDDEQYLFQALRVGAAGTCSSGSTARSWSGTCERVARRRDRHRPDARRAGSRRRRPSCAAASSGRARTSGLTQRESEVLVAPGRRACPTGRSPRRWSSARTRSRATCAALYRKLGGLRPGRRDRGRAARGPLPVTDVSAGPDRRPPPARRRVDLDLAGRSARRWLAEIARLLTGHLDRRLPRVRPSTTAPASSCGRRAPRRWRRRGRLAPAAARRSASPASSPSTAMPVDAGRRRAAQRHAPRT